jgi:hypothetical protein
MSSRKAEWGIFGILILAIRELIVSIIALLWREIWIVVKIPYEILLGWYQLYSTISEVQVNLEIFSSILSIYNNFTSGSVFPENLLRSIDPFGNLLWIGFWAIFFWYIGIPVIKEVISIVSDLS